MIIGMRRIPGTATAPMGLGDNWYMTQLKNGALVAGLCDGTGFSTDPGFDDTSYNSRLYEILGTPPDVSFRPVDGYPALTSVWNSYGRAFSRYYGFGIVAIGDHIYQFMSTPKTIFGPADNAFIGAKLIHSPDGGATWLNQNNSPVRYEGWEERSKGNMAFFYEPGECFSLISVLQMGRGYEENRDGYVYIYAPNGNVDGTMNQLVMLRVQPGEILNSEKYEYFVRLDGENGVWSSDIAARGVVHEFPRGWVNDDIRPGRACHPYAWQPTVIYNAPLKEYMMLSWGMGVDACGDWFTKPSYLCMLTAKQPWGPWELKYEDAEWLPRDNKNARAYQPTTTPKWLSPDGKRFWMIWTDFMHENDASPYYAFNAEQVELITDG